MNKDAHFTPNKASQTQRQTDTTGNNRPRYAIDVRVVTSDVNKDLGPKAKAKDWGSKATDSRSHKAKVQRQYLKVKDDNDHRLYVFHC